MKDPLARLTFVRVARRDGRARDLATARAREALAQADLSALETELGALDDALEDAGRPVPVGARISGSDLAAAGDLRRRLRLTIVAVSERRDQGEEALADRATESGKAKDAVNLAQRALDRWDVLLKERGRRAAVHADIMSELVEERPTRRRKGV